MNFLLDTDVVSQTTKEKPHEGTIRWLQNTPPSKIHLSVISVLEIRQGLDRLPAGKNRNQLSEWLKRDLTAKFDQRILPVTIEIADDAGALLAVCLGQGFNIDPTDALIAATARVHGMSVATLNLKHFKQLDVPLVDLT